MGEAKKRREGLIEGPSAPTPTTERRGDRAMLEEAHVVNHLDAGSPIPKHLAQAALRLGRAAKKKLARMHQQKKGG